MIDSRANYAPEIDDFVKDVLLNEEDARFPASPSELLTMYHLLTATAFASARTRQCTVAIARRGNFCNSLLFVRHEAGMRKHLYLGLPLLHFSSASQRKKCARARCMRNEPVKAHYLLPVNEFQTARSETGKERAGGASFVCFERAEILTASFPTPSLSPCSRESGRR